MLALGASLAGCAKNKLASLTGACEAFGAAPTYEVRGATRYDQDWIDDKIEAGVGACAWQRPAPRPAELDRPAAAKPAAAAPLPNAKPKKPGLWKRVKKKVTG